MFFSKDRIKNFVKPESKEDYYAKQNTWQILTDYWK